MNQEISDLKLKLSQTQALADSLRRECQQLQTLNRRCKKALWERDNELEGLHMETHGLKYENQWLKQQLQPLLCPSAGDDDSVASDTDQTGWLSDSSELGETPRPRHHGGFDAAFVSRPKRTRRRHRRRRSPRKSVASGTDGEMQPQVYTTSSVTVEETPQELNLAKERPPVSLTTNSSKLLRSSRSSPTLPNVLAKKELGAMTSHDGPSHANGHCYPNGHLYTIVEHQEHTSSWWDMFMIGKDNSTPTSTSRANEANATDASTRPTSTEERYCAESRLQGLRPYASAAHSLFPKDKSGRVLLVPRRLRTL